MSDNYEFSRSSHKQSQEDYTPYQSKQFNFINDTNSGIYNNNSLTLLLILKSFNGLKLLPDISYEVSVFS